MADSRDNKSGSDPSWPIRTPAQPAASPQSEHPPADRGAGRIVHDERGNAVWNWVKETGRFCVDSTSALLKKLDISDLKIEGNDETLGARQDQGVGKGARDSGGGYDPYNQKTPAKKSSVPAKPTLNKPYVRPEKK
jgi:hypothetical protein